MTEQIHEDEVDTSKATVRALLADQCGEWSRLPLSYLKSSGTSNAMWRISRERDDDLVVRLPRTPDAAQSVQKELTLLPALADTSLTDTIATPKLRHAGEPTDDYPHPWAVLGWLDGADAWSMRHDLEPSPNQFVSDMADAVRTIRSLDNLPVQSRRDGGRGGPLRPLLSQLDRWLDDPAWSASEFIDTAAVRRSAAESAEVADEPVDFTFVHGDLIPGNLLTQDGRLTAIIDWGSAAWADPAQDLSPAWAVFDRRGRQVFREAVEADDATWLRARAFELEHAVGGIVYYAPRQHPLAEVMARTLNRILD